MKLSLFSKKTNLPFFNDKNLKLNLGCGNMYLKDWVNIDINTKVKVDFCCDFLSLKHHFKKDSVKEILSLHSVSYLRLWEARIFFKDMFNILESGGKIILEFPDIVKCASVLSTTKDLDQYLEAIRGIYAFDMDQIKNEDSFITYAFGWSEWHIINELKNTGFTIIKSLDPQSHGERLWRDTRIEAIK